MPLDWLMSGNQKEVTKMKHKYSFLIAGIVVLIVACASIANQNNAINDSNNKNWQAKAPLLFSSIGQARLIESASYLPESVQRSWKITNPFGIRDDVLDYLLQAIPESNNKARMFAIRMAAYDQAAMFASESQLNKLQNKSYAATICWSDILSPEEGSKLIKGYGTVLRKNNIAKSLWESVENKLNNHVISADFGIRGTDLNAKCKYLLGEF